jgi:hypothetical protein
MTKIFKKNYKYGIVSDSSTREYPDFSAKNVGTFHGRDIIERQGITTFEDLVNFGTLDALLEGKIFNFYEIISTSGDLKWVYEGQVPRNRSLLIAERKQHNNLADEISPSQTTMENTENKSFGSRAALRALQETIESLRAELSREREDRSTRINEAISEWKSKYEIINQENNNLRENLEKRENDYRDLFEMRIADTRRITELESDLKRLEDKKQHEITTLSDSFRKEKELEEKIRSLMPKKNGLMDMVKEIKTEIPEVGAIGVELIKNGPGIVREFMSGLRSIINKEPSIDNTQLPPINNDLEVL